MYAYQSPASTSDAINQQKELRSKLILERTWDDLSVIGAVDCSYSETSDKGAACVVLYRYPDLVELAHTVVEHSIGFPYIPGLLAFRELPLILAAIESLSQMPDLWLVDGQGIAHPRRMGLASHLGILLDSPTIGCAKGILIGEGDEPAQTLGAWMPLRDKGDTIGALLRSRARSKPIVVSPGHKIDLEASLEIVKHCCDGKRIPKPLREADKIVVTYSKQRGFAKSP